MPPREISDAVRIYTLAKELKLDSKVLVDLLAQAGITVKGSALASLTEDELATFRAFMAKGGGAAAPKPAAAAGPKINTGPAPLSGPLRREDSLPPVGKLGGKPPPLAPKAPPVLKTPKPAPVPTPPPVEEVEPEVIEEPQVAEQPPEVEVQEEPTPVAEAPNPRRPVLKPQRPMDAGQPVPVRPTITPRPPMNQPTPRKTPADKGPRAPTIRVAPLPTVAQPAPVAKAAEPAPQKPDIKLPMDAIRASRAAASGASPLQAQVKKHQDLKKGDTPSAPTGPAAGGGDRGRRPGAPAGGAGGKGGHVLRPLLDQLEADEQKKKREKIRADEERAGAGKKGGGKLPAAADTSLGGREARQLSRRRSTTSQAEPPKRISLGDDDRPVRYRKSKPKKTGQNTAAPRKNHVVVQMPCTVRSFSESIGVRAPQVLAKLMSLGKMVNINAEIDLDTLQYLAADFGVEIELREAIDIEQQMLDQIENQQDAPEQLEPRAPVVTFLGHVDHGKTSLLDRIIGINVAAGESGGITQHIRAYRVEKDGRPIAFVDTPGHEAFTEMRARGANVTDIAVLVVAGDDGVMPQTEEAISHAKAAGVPIVVALNKADLPGVDKTRILQQLATAGLLATEWGGDVEVVPTSALKGTGISELLDMILTIAELHEYKANPNRLAYGTCLEARLHEGRGVVSTVMVQNGTLKVGDVIVCGSATGRVKAIYDTLHPRKTYESVGPATPVNITGLDTPPGAGDHFYILEDIAQARSIAAQRENRERFQNLGGGVGIHVTLENLHERLSAEKAQTLNVILRADVRGSIEAILKEFGKLQHNEVQIKVLQSLVGGISEADVQLADASDAIIIGFNVVPDDKARVLAQDRGVQVRRYDIIYQVTDDLKKALEGMLTPEKRDVDLGRALVQRTFVISRVGTVAGCRVLSGTIERNSRVRIIRDNRVIGDYGLDSLKREKDDAREVREGLECGIKLAGFNDLKEGDVLEAYKVEEVARTL
jgi:translation initiation factor IF-2